MINILLKKDIGLNQGRKANQSANFTSCIYSIQAKNIDNVYSLLTEISYIQSHQIKRFFRIQMKVSG